MARTPDAKLRRWALAASLGGFLFGYNVAAIGGALLSVRSDLGLGPVEQGLLVSLLPLGAMVGSVVNGRLADTLGRRRTLLLDGVAFLAAAALAAAAPGYSVLLLSRAVAGLAVGSVSATAPLYLSEIAPPALRGRLVTTNQVQITLGILAAYLVALAAPDSWRIVFAAGLVPGAVFVLALTRCPETPAWLQLHGRREEARRVLLEVVPEQDAERLLDVQPAAAPSVRVPLRAIAGPPLVIGLTLAVLQQLTGINAVFSYAPSIMERTGLSASNSILAAVAVAAVNVGATLLALPLVDRIGRRALLLVSLAGMAVSLGVLGLAFTASGGSGLSLACLVAYIVAFELGMGPIFWLLVAEIFRPETRASGAGVSTAVNWLANFAVGFTFPALVSWLGQGETFWVYAAACVLGVLFVHRFVPETKARTFPEIDAELRARFGQRLATTIPGRQ
ncbi:MAG: sugar porter family MFS transporter [Gaiellaceae bacterium]